MKTPLTRLPLAALLTALAVTLALPAAARCIDEDAGGSRPDGMAEAPVVDPTAPRVLLHNLLRDAMGRSNAIGAARLLAEAAQSDIEEARAAKRPQASLSGVFGPTYNEFNGSTDTQLIQARATLSIGSLLYDGGRTDRLTDWRSHLAEAAQLGQIGAQEQVSLQTVSLALDRARYRQQVQVYDQYARKMGCLVEALQTIVNADKGRASELVQAQKNLKQAEMARVQTVSLVRQTETRLRRFVGDGLPPTEGMSTVLATLAPLDDLLAQADRASDIASLGAQADAADSYTRAVEASQKPQLSWNFSGSKSTGSGPNRSSSLGAGVAFNIPLLDASTEHAVDAARKRADAARLQREDALEARRYRMAEVHEQALSSFDRAHRVVEVLRDSNLVRNFTLQQWQQLGRRSLFDVMSAESEHYNLRIAYVNALFDGEQANALLWSLGIGVAARLE
jgi:adhesin transport system outer membrane protein